MREIPVNRAQLETGKWHEVRFCKPLVGSSILSAGTSLRSLRELRLGKPAPLYRCEASEGCPAEALAVAGAANDVVSYGWASG
jgi:hypothetical protein